MDFSKLTMVSNANPSGQNFDLKWSKAKEEFRFSDKVFAQMQLEYNSLAQFENTENKVIIAVCPGNEGIFYKKQTGKVKGKRVKNGRLSQACEEAGLTTDLSVKHLGTFEQKEMYEVVNRVPQVEGVTDNPYLDDEEKSTLTDLEQDVNIVEPVHKDSF